MSDPERHTLRPWQLAVPACLVLAWDMAVRTRLLPASQSASPWEVSDTLVRLISHGSLLQHTSYSLARLVTGVGLGCGFALAFSFAIALSRRISEALLPTVRVLAGVPVVLWMPFCVMFLGTGEIYKISLVCIATFFMVQVFVIQSLRYMERRFVEVVEMYQKSAGTQIRHIFFPGSMPAILTSLRAAFAGGWVILFFVEFAASEHGREGLGWFVADARNAGRVEEEFAGLFWLALIAFMLDVAIAAYQRRKLRWFDAEEHAPATNDTRGFA